MTAQVAIHEKRTKDLGVTVELYHNVLKQVAGIVLRTLF